MRRPIVPPPPPQPVPGRPASAGVSVEDVTPDVARKRGLPAGLQGVVVIEVLPGGPAAEAGVRPGDVIQEVNRRPVRSAREFARAVAQAGGGDLVVLVNRSRWHDVRRRRAGG